MRKVYRIAALCLSLILAGCTYPGSASYRIEPVVIEGQAICCAATIFNAKDYDMLKFTIEKKPDGGVIVSLTELGVGSSSATGTALEGVAEVIKVAPLEALLVQ